MEILQLGTNSVLMCTPAGPVVTDNGNFVIDAPFEREKMLDPASVRGHIRFKFGRR